MNCKKEQVGDLYIVFDLSKEVDEGIFPILSKILKREKISNCLEFLSSNLNLVEQEIQQVRKESLLYKVQRVNFGINNIKRITDVLKIIKDHEFSKQNFSIDEQEELKTQLIIKISWDKNIIEFLKFLVHLTALDERYIQCGSNSLHLLVQMKVDLREQCFEDIRIRNTVLFGANLVRCNLSGSEFDNVIISGMNLNGAKLFNCKWRNIQINELNQLNGHTKQINQVCFSPDGNLLASCSEDKSIRICDVRTGKIKSIILGEGKVKSVCFSHNSTTLAFISRKHVYLRNLKTGKQISKLFVHNYDVDSVCFSPDGATLASGSIFLWDVKTGQQKAKLNGHSSTVCSICFSPDGTTLASGGGGCFDGGDCSIHLWDVKKGQLKAKLDGHSQTVQSVCFSPNGATLASGSGSHLSGSFIGGEDCSVRLWDVKTGQQKAKLNCPQQIVRSVCFSPDGIIKLRKFYYF